MQQESASHFLRNLGMCCTEAKGKWCTFIGQNHCYDVDTKGKPCIAGRLILAGKGINKIN